MRVGACPGLGEKMQEDEMAMHCDIEMCNYYKRLKQDGLRSNANV